MESGAKYWIGNLARTASYGVVFANMVVDNKSYGVHCFLVEIRNIKGEINPGIEIGDCGPKLGM